MGTILALSKRNVPERAFFSVFVQLLGCAPDNEGMKSKQGNRNPELATRGVWLCAAVTVVGLTACSPAINPVLQRSVDSQIAGATTKPEVYTSNAAELPLAAGQWTRYKVIDRDGTPSLVTHKLIATDGHTHTVEIVLESYYLRQVYRMTLRAPRRPSPSELEILAAVEKLNDDKPRSLTALELSLTGAFLRSTAFTMLVPAFASAEGKTVRVTAGTFRGAEERDVELRWGPFSHRARAWYHPAVPMAGMVRSAGVSDAASSELLDFGLSGARSELGS